MKLDKLSRSADLRKVGESDLPPWLENKRRVALNFLEKASTSEDKELAVSAAKVVLSEIDFWRANERAILSFKKSQGHPKDIFMARWAVSKGIKIV
jgi:hypothetical protein